MKGTHSYLIFCHLLRNCCPHCRASPTLFSFKPHHAFLPESLCHPFLLFLEAFPAKLVFYSHCTQRSIPPTHLISSFPTTTALQNSCPRSPHSYCFWSCYSVNRMAPKPSFPCFHWLLAPTATLSLANYNLQTAVLLASPPPPLIFQKPVKGV